MYKRQKLKTLIFFFFFFSAHTLNLIATADVHSVPGWNQGFRAPFTKAAAKAQGTWNLQNRSSVVTNSIKEKTGRKLKTFCVTR